MTGEPAEKIFLAAVHLNRFDPAEQLLRFAIRTRERCPESFVLLSTLSPEETKYNNEGLRTSFAGSYREAQQLLGGIKPVKVHGSEEYFLSRFSRHSAVLAQMYARLPVFANSAR